MNIQLIQVMGDNSRRWTPLHMACQKGHLEIVKFLIEEKGWDHTQLYQNVAGAVYNVLDVACVGGHVDTAKYLIEEKHYNPMGSTASTHTPLSIACTYDCLEYSLY